MVGAHNCLQTDGKWTMVIHDPPKQTAMDILNTQCQRLSEIRCLGKIVLKISNLRKYVL